MKDPIEILKNAEKHMYHISGIAYSDVKKLQVAFDKKGIKNNVDAGGLFIYPRGNYEVEVSDMFAICESFKDDFTAVPIKGVSQHMSDVILNTQKIERTPFPKG